jgi:predicted FMN-binding regulatory protein PaiB
MYRGAFQEIRALTLTVHTRKVKWKLGQNRKPGQLMKVIDELRRRGRPTDAAAADALQWSMDRDAAK